MEKKVWLLIAVLAIGVLVLPQTIAMFAGQHNWYDTFQPNAIPCEKCHADIFSEISSGTGGVNAAHRALSGNTGCDACHVTTAPTIEGLTKGPGGQFHAAAAPACLDCHSGNGQGGGAGAAEILNGTEEVHKAFANQSLISKFLKGANEACISCHTHIGVNITWTKATTINFDAAETVLSDGSHSWTVDNFGVSGTNITHTNG